MKFVRKAGKQTNAEMYLIKNGRLRVLNENKNQTLALLEEGAVFGELSILHIPGNLHKNKRSASIQSVGYSTLYALTKDDLWQALYDYPKEHERLIEKGKQILRRNNLLDESEEILETFYSSFTESRGHLTIEDRLLKISEAVDQLNDMTDNFERYYYV
ncbi:Cyclic nucleotide-binding domain-containing protein [Aphelenchoides bicaudatus]|nr:Cyclic nucleotide-binding domain-containing protein [Aphelenchoides bicaudatus]